MQYKKPIDIQKGSIHIPLPNEQETGSLLLRRKEKPMGLNSIINFIREHIRIEELILIGLIVLLLDESIEDNFLLIILIYVLLF